VHVHITPELLANYAAKVPNLRVILQVTQLFCRHATLPSVAVVNQDILVLAMAKAASVHHDTIAIRGGV